MNTGPANNSLQRVLVFALGGAGDVLLTSPLLHDLRTSLPDSQIEVLVMQGPPARDVLRANPDVDSLIFHNFMAEPYWSSIALLWRLRRAKYDLLVVPMPHNRPVYHAMAMFVGGRTRIGMEYKTRSGSGERLVLHRTVREDPQIRLVENNRRLLREALDLPLVGSPSIPRLHFQTEDVVQQGTRLLDSLGYRSGDQLIGMHPGSGGTKNLTLKRWSADRWAELAARLIAAGSDRRVLLFGGPDEEGLRAGIARQADSDRVLAVETTELPVVADVMSRCRLFVSADTLLAHVANVVGTPLCLLIGPTPIAPIRPMTGQIEYASARLPCSPCYGYSRFGIRCHREVPLQCMKELTVDLVLETIARVLIEPVRENASTGG